MNNLIKFTSHICTLGSCPVYAAPLTKIIGNWHFDEEHGQKALDLSYYGKHGQLGSTLGVDANDPTWTTRRFDTATFSIDYTAFPNKDLYIGDYDGEAACPEYQYNFSGDIDEVRIWNKALTADEIATRYHGD